MIKIKHKGDFKALHKVLEVCTNSHYESILNYYGQKGVEALRAATPQDTGKTADSWSYEIRTSAEKGYYAIIFNNSNIQNGYANIAILLQYGHATRNGGYVQGRDYINPAVQPIFDEIAEKVWKEIKNA